MNRMLKNLKVLVLERDTHLLEAFGGAQGFGTPLMTIGFSADAWPPSVIWVSSLVMVCSLIQIIAVLHGSLKFRNITNFLCALPTAWLCVLFAFIPDSALEIGGYGCLTLGLLFCFYRTDLEYRYSKTNGQ